MFQITFGYQQVHFVFLLKALRDIVVLEVWLAFAEVEDVHDDSSVPVVVRLL